MAVFFVLVVTAKSAFAFLRLNDLLTVLAAMQQILMQTASVHYHLQLKGRRIIRRFFVPGSRAQYCPCRSNGHQKTCIRDCPLSTEKPPPFPYNTAIRQTRNYAPKTVQHSYFYIILSTVLVNNFVLSQFLGLCPFMGVSRKIDTALGMGLATAFVLTLSAVSAYLLDTYLLEPFGLRYLRTIGFIVAIAVLVGLTEMFIAKTSPVLHRLLGVYLPLITTNCAVLGVALLNANQHHNLLQSALYGFGAAVGFTLVLIIFAALRERLDAADVPAPFKGTPAALMTAGILAIAFMGFGGWA